MNCRTAGKGEKMGMDVHVIAVDCQYDFIDGSLACSHGKEAVSILVRFINSGRFVPLYSADWHKPSNRSFAVNGGTWPIHCVQGTRGAEIDRRFYTEIADVSKRPRPENLFRKGVDDEKEEYSAFSAENGKGIFLSEAASETIYVGGIASEYCVRETALAFRRAGRRVILLTDALGWVDENAHKNNLKDLAARGIILSDTERI